MPKELAGRCSQGPGRESPKGLMDVGQERQRHRGGGAGRQWRIQPRGQRYLRVSPWEEDEFCSDDLDRLKWRAGRRVSDTSNTRSSLCINTPVTSSPSLHAWWQWEEVSFPVLEQALFPPLTRVGVLEERCLPAIQK